MTCVLVMDWLTETAFTSNHLKCNRCSHHLFITMTTAEKVAQIMSIFSCSEFIELTFI